MIIPVVDIASAVARPRTVDDVFLVQPEHIVQAKIFGYIAVDKEIQTQTPTFVELLTRFWEDHATESLQCILQSEQYQQHNLISMGV